MTRIHRVHKLFHTNITGNVSQSIKLPPATATTITATTCTAAPATVLDAVCATSFQTFVSTHITNASLMHCAVSLWTVRSASYSTHAENTGGTHS